MKITRHSTKLLLAACIVALGAAPAAYGQCASSFAAHVDYGTANSPRAVAIGDFNGDGVLDLATANYNSSNASVLLSQAGEFAPVLERLGR